MGTDTTADGCRPRHNAARSRLPGSPVLSPCSLAGCGHRGSDARRSPTRRRPPQAPAAGLDAAEHAAISTTAATATGGLKYDNKNKYALYDLALIDAASRTTGRRKKVSRRSGIDPAYMPALFNLAIILKGKGDTPRRSHCTGALLPRPRRMRGRT